MAEDEGGGLQYWLQWQVAVCAVIIAGMFVGSVVAIRKARPEPLRSADMWAPCWQGMHPLWLLAARVLALVAMSWLLYEILVLFGPLVFYFYTMWTFALVIIYFAVCSYTSPLYLSGQFVYIGLGYAIPISVLWVQHGYIPGGHSFEYWFRLSMLTLELLWDFMLVLAGCTHIYLYCSVYYIAAVVSAYGCWIYSKQLVYENKEDKGSIRRNMDQKTPATSTSRKSKNQNAVKLKSYNEQVENEQKAGFLGYLMQIVYQICGGAVMQTDIVFWLLLLPFMSNEHFSLTMVIGSMHSVNAVFLLLDTTLNRLPFPWFRMAYFILFSCAYVTFHWVLHARGSSWWPYPFLELATPWAPVWYLGLALVHILCYGLYYAIVKAKNSYFSKGSLHAYKKAQ